MKEDIPAQKSRFIQITQEGIGRIIFDRTPADIAGLYTEGLQTCLAILAVGSKGVVLIHSTGRIIPETIREEFGALGEIQSWTIKLNLPHLMGNELLLRQALKKAQDHKEVIEKYFPRNYSPVFAIQSDCICIDRAGKITFQRPAVLELPDAQIRLRVNILNAMAAIGGFVRGDLQYDGENLTALPIPLHTPERMRNIFLHDLGLTGEQRLDALGQLRSYLLAVGRTRDERLVQKIYANEQVIRATLHVRAIDFEAIAAQANALARNRPENISPRPFI